MLVNRAHICKLLWSPGIDSEEAIPRKRFRQSTYVARRAGTSNRVVVPARQAENRFLGSLKGLQIRAQRKLATQTLKLTQLLTHTPPPRLPGPAPFIN
jgi:hypothetical protein